MEPSLQSGSSEADVADTSASPNVGFQLHGFGDRSDHMSWWLHRSLTSTAVEVTSLLVCWIIVAKRPETESGKEGFTGRETQTGLRPRKTVPTRDPSVHRTTLAADACC